MQHFSKLMAPLAAAAVAIAMGFAVTPTPALEARTTQQQLPADPRGEVIINNVNGSIEVSTWDQPQVLAIAQLGDERLGLELRSGDKTTEVRITGYDTGSGRGATANLQVRIPRQSALTVTAVSARVRSSGVRGAQRLQTVSGDIVAEVAESVANVRSVSGNITLTGNGQPGQLTASSVSGDISVHHGGGELEATTVSGALHAELDPLQMARVRTTSGDITVNGALAHAAQLDGQSISGIVRIQVRAADGFAYQLSTFSGAISDCFGQPTQGSGLAGTEGAGGADIHVKTLSGALSLCDR